MRRRHLCFGDLTKAADCLGRWRNLYVLLRPAAKPGRTKKIVLEREDAAERCTDPLLRSYYETLDEYWMAKCWEKVVEERLQHAYQWQHMQNDCYMYFFDRAKRFSMLYDPTGMLLFHMKGLKAKLRKEISTDIPYRMLMQTNESLRNIDQYANLNLEE